MCIFVSFCVCEFLVCVLLLKRERERKNKELGRWGVLGRAEGRKKHDENMWYYFFQLKKNSSSIQFSNYYKEEWRRKI